jgi:hypothetical protein
MWPALHPHDAARIAAGEMLRQATDPSLTLRRASALLARVRQQPALTGSDGVAALPPDALAWPACSAVEGIITLREMQRQMQRYDAFNPQCSNIGDYIPQEHMDDMYDLLLKTFNAVQVAGRVLLARAAAGTLLHATRDEALFCAAVKHMTNEAEWLASRRRLPPSAQRGCGYHVALDVGTLVVSCWRQAQLHGFDCRDAACLARGSPCKRARQMACAYDFFAPHVVLALAAVRDVGRAQGHIVRQEAAFLRDLDSLLLSPSGLPVPLTQSFRDADGPRAMPDALLADGGAVLAVLRDAARAMETKTHQLEHQEQQLLQASRRRVAAAPRRHCAAEECGKQEDYPDEFKKCAACARVAYCSRACQVQHWRAVHKRECAAARSAAAAGDA